MSPPMIFHIVPLGTLWQVKSRHGGVIASYDTQQKAIDAAKRSAQHHLPSRVIVYDEEHHVEKEWMFGIGSP